LRANIDPLQNLHRKLLRASNSPKSVAALPAELDRHFAYRARLVQRLQVSGR
jgi:hypothetical protein